MDRRLAEIPTAEWGDLSVDITPREYVLDYLAHSFPTQLFELFTDEEGNLPSRPAVRRDGQPVQSREAVERRDRMIERLAALPPVPGALDQIVHRFGTDQVAEVTGRSRRIVARATGSASKTARLPPISPKPRPSWTTRSASSSSPTPAAPGAAITPISAARNQRLRVHYLLGARLEGRCRDPGPRPLEPHQPGAAAGVPPGRHQRQGREALPLDDRAPPRHAGRDHPRPAPDRRPGPVPRRRQSRKPSMPGRRCASSICCSIPARSRAARCSDFRGRDRPRSLRPGRRPARGIAADHELPQPAAGARASSCRTRCSRCSRNCSTAKIEGAIASGTYDLGRRDADRREPPDRRAPHDLHPSGDRRRDALLPSSGADRNKPLPLADALALARRPRARLLVNGSRGRAAVQMPAPSLMLDDGEVERRVRLIRPMERETIALDALRPLAMARGRRATPSRRCGRPKVAAVPEFCDQRLPHRHRPAAADLGPAAAGQICASTASDR